MISPSDLCPCGSKRTANQCCLPNIKGQQTAETAEALMRSRYTAYTLADVDYILKSHHISTRPSKERKEILQWARSVKWMGLSILSKRDGEKHQTEGMVEFRALFVEQGRMQQIHERSLFRKEKGQWYYLSGEHY